MIHVERIVSGTWRQNGYVVAAGLDAVVIDPGGELEAFERTIGGAGLRLHAVVNTHAHYDHLGAVAPLVEMFGVPFYLHRGDEDLLQRANFYQTLFLGTEPITTPRFDAELSDAMSLQFGALELKVLHTPGHTPGSVCIEVGGELFTGDTLMARHLGRTDLPGGDRPRLLASVDRIGALYGGETPLHPGHGDDVLLGDALRSVAALPELRG